MNEAERRVLLRAAQQYGLVRRADARHYEMSERQIDNRLATGRWTVVHRGVYRVAGAPVTTRQRLLAATLWQPDDCAVSHLAAGRLLRLDGVPRPNAIDVSIGTRRGRESAEIVVHRTRLDRVDRVTVDRIPCTSATRTIIDLAAVLDVEALESAFESARRLRLTAPGALAQRAAALCGRGRPGSARIRHLLAVIENRPLESVLEVKVAQLLRSHGLTAPANQFVVGEFRLDYAWPRLLLALECDGFEHHGRRLVWKQDRRRIAALEAAGWRIVHVTWDDVTRYKLQTIDRVRLALVERAA